MPEIKSTGEGANPDRNRIIARLLDLPSLPALLMEALQHTNDRQNLSQLADKISRDPAMVGRILRIANSPFYGMSREIGSLREAVVLLGVNRVRDMLLSACFLNMLPIRGNGFDYPLFWRHSLSVAHCARQLGSHTGIGEDLAFTAGLLHDIGRLAAAYLFPDDYCLISQQTLLVSLESERRIFGFDHVEIGGKVARQWNLPQHIQEAIEQHETQPERNAAISIGVLIYASNLLVKGAAPGAEDDSAYQNAVDYVLEFLGINFEQAAIWTDAGRQFAEQILVTV